MDAIECNKNSETAENFCNPSKFIILKASINDFDNSISSAIITDPKAEYCND